MTPVLLLHAFPCAGEMWDAQAIALSEAGWDVIVPDLPGFGASDLLDAEPDLDAVARIVLRELDEQRIERFIVGGLSLGGYLTMALLRLAHQRIAAVMLCDTKASADGDAAVANRHRLADAAVANPASCGRMLRQSVLPGLLGPTTFATRPEVVTRVEGWLDAARPDTVAWYQRAMARRPDSGETLRAVDVPALVLWGDEDALSTPADHEAMCAVLRQAHPVVIDGSGHLSAVEAPDAVGAAMTAFLNALD